MGKESQPVGGANEDEVTEDGSDPDWTCSNTPTREQVERMVEHDPSLAPTGPSALLVEPAVLEPAEVRALLADLNALLAGAALSAGLPNKDGAEHVPNKGIEDLLKDTGGAIRQGEQPGHGPEERNYESHAAPVGRG